MKETPATAESKYRPEIDGLRAFAVAAVIINHFNKDIMPSGYLGVDIFFVISGFVITSSLTDRKSSNLIDFIIGFYERRIKRLVPALVVFLLITSFLICLFASKPGIPLQTAISSLYGFSNIYLFAYSTNYFAESTQLNPFTHTWSLGVEEQFYFIFPFLVWFSGYGKYASNGSRNLFCILGLLSIASLIGFIYLYQTNQPAAYFLMPARFWEMAAGSLVFLVINRKGLIGERLELVPPILVIASLGGVMLLPLELAVPATITITLLTGLLICCLKKGSAAFSLFTNQKVVYVGLISYSLYLWHWGVLTISRLTIGIHWWTVPFQIVLMLMMAIGSFRWVERPFRSRRWLSKRWPLLPGGIGALILTMIVLISFGIFKRRLYTGDYSYENLITRSRNHISYDQVVAYSGLNCHHGTTSMSINVDLTKCQLNKDNTKRIYFVGNSHSDHYRETQYLLFKNNAVSVDGISVSSCVFPPDRRQKICGDIQQSQLKRISSHIKTGDIVVVSNRYSSSLVLPDESDRWFKDSLSLESFIDFSRKITAKGASIVLFAPSPEFNLWIDQCKKVWFRPFLMKGCTLSVSELRQRRKASYEFIQSLPDGIHVYDPMKTLCFNGNCSMTDSTGKPLYTDEQHLSDYANTTYVYPDFQIFLRSNHLI